jgi:hypothetical protein
MARLDVYQKLMHRWKPIQTMLDKVTYTACGADAANCHSRRGTIDDGIEWVASYKQFRQ